MSTDKRWIELEQEVRRTFSEEGILGPRLLDIHTQEEAYEHYAGSTFTGHRVLNQSFLDFFHETLTRAQVDIARPGGSWFPALVMFYANIFSRLRSSETVFLHGYPLDAFSLLRSIKDRAIYLAAVIAEHTTFRAVLGFKASGEFPSDDYWENCRWLANRRKRAQRRAMRLVAGEESGLPEKVRNDLKWWADMLHDEVHSSWQMFTLESAVWKRERRLPLGPHQHPASALMYLNRFSEIGWCVHRTLPFLQMSDQGMGHQWTEKWRLLDEYFRCFLEGLQEQGTELVPSILEFIDRKFPFGPELRYKEED